MTTRGIALISGAGLDSTIWNEVLPHLKLPYATIDFPDREGKIRASLSLKDYSRHVRQQIETWKEVDEVILVAHSIGGAVATTAASELSNLRAFVGIAAAIPENGKSFMSTLPFPKRIVMATILKIAGTKPPDSAIKAGLCNGLNKKQTDQIINNFTPESKRLYTDNAVNHLNVSCHYIRTKKDKEFTTKQMTQMAKNLNEAHITDIDTGHLPMIEQPKQLANLINKIA